MTRGLPEPIRQSRRRRCGECGCGVDVADPCARCPRGRWLPVFCAPPAAGGGGAGTELKGLLGRLGIEATGNCQCNVRAAEMDARGVEWCAENVEVITGWLREEAAARGWPFFAPGARVLVRRAIALARRRAQPAQG